MRTITDFETVREIVQSKDFETYPIADTYRGISSHLDLDLRGAIELLDRMPTFLRGERHKDARSSMARQTASRRKEQIVAAETYLAGFERDSLKPGATIDLLTDFARPLFRAIKKATLPQYAEHDELFDLIEQIPLLLAPATPIRRRMKISDGIMAFADRFGEQLLYDITLLVLGQGPLTGSLTISIHDILTRNAGLPLSAIAWPSKLPDSVLTFVDRICTTPATVGGESFELGDYVRCVIRPPDWNEDQIETMKFGAGSHLCIGRPLSEIVWTMVVGTLQRSDLVATAGVMEMRFGKEPFNMPAKAEITLHESVPAQA